MEYGRTANRTLIGRMVGAAQLNPNTYEDVERDRSATGQAAQVVVIVGVAQAIAMLLSLSILGAVWAVPSVLIGWVVWSYITYFVGVKLFATQNTRVSPGEMLRTLGFAHTPLLLGVFAFIPFIGWMAALVGAIWALVAGVIAVRQAMDFDTGRAVLTVLVGAIPFVLLQFVLSSIGLGIGF